MPVPRECPPGRRGSAVGEVAGLALALRPRHEPSQVEPSVGWPCRGVRGRGRGRGVRRIVRYYNHPRRRRRQQRGHERVRGGRRAVPRRHGLLLGPVRSAGRHLPRGSPHQLRGDGSSVRDIARLLLAVVRRRLVLGRGVHVGRRIVHHRHAVLRRNVCERDVQGAQHRLQDRGQHVLAELRVLLAAMRGRAVLDRFVLLRPSGRHLHAGPGLLRRGLHDRSGQIGRAHV